MKRKWGTTGHARGSRVQKKKRQHLTAQVEQLAARSALLHQIVQGIGSSQLPDDLLQTTVEQLSRILEVPRCLIFGVDGDRLLTSCYLSEAIARDSSRWDLSDIISYIERKLDDSLWQGQPVFLSQSELEIPSNLLIVPLIYQGSYMGGLIVETDGDLHAQEVEFVKQVAAHGAIAMGQEKLSQLIEQVETSFSKGNQKLKELEVRIDELRWSEARFRNLVENSQDWVWEVDVNYIYTYASPQVQEILGYAPAEIIGKSADELMPKAEGRRVRQFLLEMAGLSIKCMEHRNIHKDGQIIFLESSGVPIVDDRGNCCGYRGITRDISDRKQASEKLQLLHLFLDRAKDGVFVSDREGQFVYVNEMALLQLGYSRPQLLQMRVHDIDNNFSPSSWPQHWEKLKQRGSLTIESTHRASSDRNLPVEISFNYLEFNGKAYNCAIVRDITERKQAELALQESMAQFRGIFQHSPMGIALCDRDGNLLQVNPALCKMLGYTESELLQINLMRLTHGSDRETERPYFQQCRDGEIRRYKIEKRYIHQNGKMLKCNQTVGVILDEEGKMRYNLAMIEDLTEHKQVIERLRLRERAMDASHNGIIICDARAKLINLPIVYVNAAFERITGYSAAEALGKNCRFLQGDDREQPALDMLRKAIGKQQDCRVMLRNYRKDGTLFWNELSISPIYDEEGNLTHYIGIQMDMTDRKQAEEELLMSQARLQYLLSSSPGALYSRKPTGEYDIIFISDNVTAICGYTAAEFTKNPSLWASHIHPEDGPIAQSLTNLLEQGRYDCEYRFRHKNGSNRWMYDQMRLVRDDKGNPLEIVGCWSDISKLKLTEEYLLQAKDQLRAVLDAVPGFVSWMSCDLRYIGVNQHLAKGLNLSPEDFVGKELGFMENSPGFAKLMRQFLASPESATQQVIDARVNEATHHYLIAAQKYQQGKAAVSVGIDITYLMKTEAQLKSSLKEKEVLLKEIHHRVKNNLQVISSLLKLQSGYTKDEATRAFFQDSYNRVRSMALIHENLYRSQDLGRINVADYIRTLTANLFGSYSRSDRLIDLHLDLEQHWLDVDTAIPCGLIINELVSNCFKYAFPVVTRGDLNVKFVREGDQYILQVRDNGIGLPADFNLEEAESLGLQLVQNLTTQLGGDLLLDCSKGTCFTITFKANRVAQRREDKG